MTSHPYRKRQEPPAQERAVPAEQRLGERRSIHPTPRRSLVWPLLAGAFIAVMLTLSMSRVAGWKALLASLPVAVVVFAVSAWPALRRRGVQVEVHEEGVVVTRPGQRDIAIFDDVDEVWMDLEVMSSYVAEVAQIRHLVLVDHGGAKHRIPIDVDDGAQVARVILRRCSAVLASDAKEALASGETLTFGPVKISTSSIEIGDRRVAWGALSLVRFLPGRIAFFRGQTIFPWRTVHLDRVPHPTLVMKFVAELAPRKESANFPASWYE